MSGTRLPSYRPCPHTGQECPFGTAAEPCWGPVTMWSDFFDEERLYCCDGHSWGVGIPYRPSAEPGDREAPDARRA
jgi:hypothetical protein